MFSGLLFTSRKNSVEHYMFWMQVKGKNNVYVCCVNCKEVLLYSLFWQVCQCRSHCGLTMCANSLCPPPCPSEYKRHSALANLAHGASTGRSSAWVYLVTQSWSPFTPWESTALSHGVKLFHASFRFPLFSKNHVLNWRMFFRHESFILKKSQHT